ncbi:MAG: membrane protein insertase YidC [Verrucomicrobiales bacterium]|nr:membrane protein insertase YidC [Verrucomicrobiales bacterium]
MDRTAWIAVILCSLGMMLWWQKFGKIMPPTPAENEIAAAEGSPKNKDPEQSSPASEQAKQDSSSPQAESQAKAPTQAIKVQTVSMQLEQVNFEFTSAGGGIQQVELLDHDKIMGQKDEHITLNAFAPHAIGTLSSGPGDFESTIYEIIEQDKSTIVFAGTDSKGLHIQKRYSLGQTNRAGDNDPHLVQLEIEISNLSKQKLSSRYFLYTGAAVPLATDQSTKDHPSKANAYSPTYYFLKDKGGFEYENVSHFIGGMFSSEKPSEVVHAQELSWAGTSNQFYTTIVEALEPTDVSIWASTFEIKNDLSDSASDKKKPRGIQTAIGLPELSLSAGEKITLKYEIYAGPKEYARLKALGDDRTLVMNYDGIPIFGWILGWAIRPLAAFLIWALVWMQGTVGQFGFAIILITIMIRIVIWPVYAKSTRTMKKMAKLGPLQKELKEKYKDDPNRLNQETMQLYRDYKINPAGGCLPMFIQMPVFLGFYRMLFNAVELRHQSFLWVEDLSMPDTLFHLPFFDDIPFNLLPLLMAVTMIIQMQLTPKSGDKAQQRIFMFMPVFFLFICYNFASALALYWTTQNIFSIGQTWLMNKLPEPELKKVKTTKKAGGGFLSRMQEQAEAQKQKQKTLGDRGERHTQSRSKKKKKKN